LGGMDNRIVRDCWWHQAAYDYSRLAILVAAAILEEEK